MHRARFFFDAGSGGVLWLDDPADQQRWGNPADPGRLPIGEELRRELGRLVAWYDTSLNWDYPPDPGPWREPECREFNAAARSALRASRTELGPDWEIVDRLVELHEGQP